MSNPKITLGYWKLRGLGQPIRFLAAYLGLKLNEKLYTMEDWDKWINEEKYNLGLDFPNLPYLFDGDVKMTESRAILKYLAMTYGKNMVPSKPEDIRNVDMIENMLWDMWQNLLKYVYNDLEALMRYIESSPKKFEMLNKFLGNKKFILEDQISYVDFILYEVLYVHSSWQAQYFAEMPNLVRFKKDMEELPAIKAFMASPEYIPGPITAPFAKINIG